MIKEALQYVVGLSKEPIISSNGYRYTDKSLTILDDCMRAEAVNMTTLSGLVDYIKGNVDTMAEKMLIQVVSPIEVRLISQLNDDRKRECLIKVNAELPDFSYGKFMSTEAFLIGLRSKFIQNEGAENLLRFAGTVENGTVAKYGDDGISQTATVKKGIAGKESALVPNPVRLRPYRTFTEVQQPESEFVFRMKDCDGDVACAIFEADGGAWRRAAMKNVKEHLEAELDAFEQFTIIS